MKIIHLSALFPLLILLTACNDGARNEAPESLIWNHAGLPRVDTIDGVGKLPPDQHREFSGKSSLVIMGNLEFSLSTGSSEAPVFSGSERKLAVRERLCLFFSVEETLVGKWPSSGIVIEAWDSKFLESLNTACFFRTNDQYMLYCEGSSPMESEKIYIKRLTDENAEQVKQPVEDKSVPRKRGR